MMNLIRIAFRVSFLSRKASSTVQLLGPVVRAKKPEDWARVNIPFGIEAEWTNLGSSRHPMGPKSGPYGEANVGFRWNEERPDFDLEHNYVMEEMPSITIESIDGFALTNQDRKLLDKAGLNDLVLAEIFSEKTKGETDELPMKSLKDWILD
jgi:hypothetical protein